MPLIGRHKVQPPAGATIRHELEELMEMFLGELDSGLSQAGQLYYEYGDGDDYQERLKREATAREQFKNYRHKLIDLINVFFYEEGVVDSLARDKQQALVAFVMNYPSKGPTERVKVEEG